MPTVTFHFDGHQERLTVQGEILRQRVNDCVGDGVLPHELVSFKAEPYSETVTFDDVAPPALPGRLTVGDVVLLASGGPKMTVVALYETTSEATCLWISDAGHVERVTVPLVAIRKA